jgi:AcrR family transcriptional regulator
MGMSTKKLRQPGPRRYTMRVRAERQADTRRRILDAAIEIASAHGPLAATLTEIAERAGVERATVYRHFPHQQGVIEAVAEAILERHPFPDPGSWPATPPRRRIEDGLGSLYRHYRLIAPMAKLTLRDAALSPGLVPLEIRDRYLITIEEALLSSLPQGGERRPARQALRHALAFGTWLSLAEGQSLSDRAAAKLMATFVFAAAGPS